MKIIKFGAVWCPGCLFMKSRWKKVNEIIPNLDITDYDYDVNSDKVEQYQIGKLLPVTIFENEEGKELERLVGEVNSEKLIEIINKYRKW